MVGCFRGNIACGSAAGRGHVERRKSKDPKVPIGTTESTVSTVGCDWRMARAPAAGGATEKMGLDRCVLSSLTGLVLCSRHNPAINRWAIFERLCGTWNRDTLNTYKARGYPHAVAPRLLHRLGDLRLPEHLPARGPHHFRETVFVGDGIERDAPALGERRPQLFFRGAAIVGRADGRKRRREQLLAHLVGRGEATVEIEDDRFGHWPLAL